MRIITCKKGKHSTDPVKIGDIFKLRHGNNWYTVIVVPESDYDSCAGCVLYDTPECRVPMVTNGRDAICGKAECIFKPVDEVLENI